MLMIWIILSKYSTMLTSNPTTGPELQYIRLVPSQSISLTTILMLPHHNLPSPKLPTFRYISLQNSCSYVWAKHPSRNSSVTIPTLLSPIGGRPVHGTDTYRVWWYQRLYNTIFDLLTMSTWCSKHVEVWNKLIVKQILCIKLVNY